MTRLSPRIVEIKVIVELSCFFMILLTAGLFFVFEKAPFTIKDVIAFCFFALFDTLFCVLIYLNSYICFVDLDSSKLIFYRILNRKPVYEIELNSSLLTVKGFFIKTIVVKMVNGKKYKAHFIKKKLINLLNEQTKKS